jgi:endonuclease/exonuclease/phosphatase family metal-dependent hydrolase
VIPLLALLPAFFFAGRYVRIDTEDERIERMATEGERLKIVSYNVGRFALQDRAAGIDSRAECIDSVFSFLKSQDADIICLQEFRVPDADKVRSYVDRYMKGYNVEYYMFPSSNGAFGNITMSRIPVKGKGKIKFDESANLAIYSDYQYAGEKFRIYNCHFESYNVSVSGLMRGLVQRDTLLISATGDKMKRSITRRPKQVDRVFEHIEECPIETFVCGDFNDNPMSYTYYRITRGRKDSFKVAGNGFGASFATMWPMLRIDYILCPKKYAPVTHQTPRVPYSDHYPVVSQIAL